MSKNQARRRGCSEVSDYHYTHPDHFNAEGFKRDEVVEVRHNDNVVLEIPIEIYRAPVMMTHGLWGNVEAFERMEKELIMGPGYANWPAPPGTRLGIYWPSRFRVLSNGLVHLESSPLTLRWGYSNEASFATNALAIRNGANKLLSQAVNAGYSAGRVDVVAHSMGGVLTRLELQRPDNPGIVRGLITLDTPHWGSQFANWLEGGSPGATLRVVRALFPLGDLSAPAVNDLRIGGSYFQVMNLKLFTELKIPMHFVGGRNTSVFNPWRVAMNVFLTAAAKRDGYTGLEGVGTPDTLFTAIFGGRPHDEIVAIQSQLGGRPESHPGVQVFPGKHHVGIMEQSDVIAHVFDVLQAARTAPAWSASVLPVASDFVYEFQPGSGALHRDARVLSREEGGIAIVTPTTGDILLAGQTVIIRVESSGSFENAALVVGQGKDMEERVIVLPHEEELEIPESAIGELMLLVYDLGDEEFAYDAVNVTIVPASDPVGIVTNWTESEFVLVGQTVYFSASLLYESGGRLALNDQNGGVIEIEHPEIADISEWGAIRGLEEGSTTVTIRFGELATSVDLNVLPGDSWDPVAPSTVGDVNGDGVVNVADVTELSALIVSGNAPPVDFGDFNGDGVVDILDVEVLAERVVNQ